jgi:transposase
MSARQILIRGKAARETETICLVSVEAQLRADHPLREVKRMCKEVLKALEPELERMVATKGRPSIPPERLLMAWILMCLYGVCSCRRFTEELPFNLRCKWFLEMNPDEAGFDSTSFSKNLGRMRTGHLKRAIFRGSGRAGEDARLGEYKMSQRLSKRIEENFGWMKALGNFRKRRWIGTEKTHFMAQFAGSACNLMRMAKLSLAKANLPLRPAAA